MCRKSRKYWKEDLTNIQILSLEKKKNNQRWYKVRDRYKKKWQVIMESTKAESVNQKEEL